MRFLTKTARAAALGLAAVGCGGGDEIPREPISGHVALDGRPLEVGLITFSPAGGGEPVISGVVIDGAYALDRVDGPSPGPHKVQVFARKATGKKVRDPDQPGAFVDEVREAIPARYNLRTDLVAEVAPGGTNRFEYNLSGKPEPREVRR